MTGARPLESGRSDLPNLPYADLLLRPVASEQGAATMVAGLLGSVGDPEAPPRGEAAVNALHDLQMLLAPPALFSKSFLGGLARSGRLSPHLPALLSAVLKRARQEGLSDLAARVQELAAWLEGPEIQDPAGSAPFLTRLDKMEAAAPSAAFPLSIVVTSRNDDHGGRLLPRMQVFFNALLAQSQRHRLHCEIILVEWNPAVDRPPLAQALDLPAHHDFAALRIIQVPAALHGGYAHAARLPLYQMIAKNVGIRRAQGEFILATNIDVLFSDPLMAWLASGPRERDRLYRVDRLDVDRQIPTSRDLDALLTYCADNVLRIHAQAGCFPRQAGEGPGDLTARARDQALSDGTRLHTNACGDFQLLHRDHWRALRGYGEFDGYSMHLDSLLNGSAHFGGAVETVLPPDHVLYHIDHDGGWSPEGDRSGQFDRDLDRRGLARVAYNDLRQATRVMAKTGAGLVFNDARWGLAGAALPEQAGWRFRDQESGDQGSEDQVAGEGTEGYPVVSLALDRRAWPLHGKLLDEMAALFLSLIRDGVAACRDGRPLYIWGTGPKGEMLVEMLPRWGVTPEGFLDSDPARQGARLCGLEIFDPAVLDGSGGEQGREQSPRPFVLVGALLHEAIGECLAALGYRAGEDFYAPF